MGGDQVDPTDCVDVFVIACVCRVVWCCVKKGIFCYYSYYYIISRNYGKTFIGKNVSKGGRERGGNAKEKGKGKERKGVSPLTPPPSFIWVWAFPLMSNLCKKKFKKIKIQKKKKKKNKKKKKKKLKLFRNFIIFTITYFKVFLIEERGRETRRKRNKRRERNQEKTLISSFIFSLLFFLFSLFSKKLTLLPPPPPPPPHTTIPPPNTAPKAKTALTPPSPTPSPPLSPSLSHKSITNPPKRGAMTLPREPREAERPGGGREGEREKRGREREKKRERKGGGGGR